jgi:hypothetical protein
MALVSATIVIAYAALLPRDNLPSFAPAMNTAMKRLVLGKDWATKRMKALRFRLIGLPGRVVRHARKLIIRLGADVEVLSTIVAARQTIRALACGPAG